MIYKIVRIPWCEPQAMSGELNQACQPATLGWAVVTAMADKNGLVMILGRKG